MRLRDFRAAVRGGKVLVGTFIKTASHQIPEILGLSGLDFSVIDCEHAPFDAVTLDRMALAARGADFPCLVRVPDLSPTAISQVLDLGLAGAMVPHVRDANAATVALEATKYGLGKRGFAPSTRAGGYGTVDAKAYREKADGESSLWCQIEDREALTQLDAIAAVDAVDCLFLGRADLALSLGVESQSDRKVIEAVAATAEAGRRHKRTVGIYIGDTAEIPGLLSLGITVFACGSDQSFLLGQSRRVRKELDAILAAR